MPHGAGILLAISVATVVAVVVVAVVGGLTGYLTGSLGILFTEHCIFIVVSLLGV